MFCLLVGGVFLTSEEYQRIGLHVAAGAVYVSNFILMNEGGYFDIAAEAKPLLHLWSLAIEEQFYLFWPLVLVVAFRVKANAFSVIVVCALVSFSANVYFLQKYPVEVFYLPATRAWELLLGGALAAMGLMKTRLVQPSIRFSNAFAWTGLFLLLVGLRGIKSGPTFPGWLALVPTVGAVLIILAGDRAWFNRRVLSARPMVLVGLISYPLYLWHWPVLSFARVVYGEQLGSLVRALLVVCAVLLAWGTYVLVERPLRLHGGAGFARFLRGRLEKAPALLFGLMLTAGFCGYLVHQIGGLSSRSDVVSRQTAELSWDGYFSLLERETFDCTPISLQATAHKYENGVLRCRQTVSESPRQDVALIGDSHAEHLFWGLAKAFRKEKNLVYYTYSCFPFSGLIRLNLQECQKMDVAIEHILRSETIKTVVLSAFWQDRLRQHDFRLLANPSVDDRHEVFATALEDTVQQLISNGKKVIVVLDGPTLSFDPVRCLRPLAFFQTSCEVPRGKLLEDQSIYRKILAAGLKEHPGVQIFDPMDWLCPDAMCPVMKDGHFLYRDRSHLTTYASEYLGQPLHRLISQP